MNDSRMIRAGSAAAVLLVAAIAAVISFVHIEHLAVTHGQTALASALLPVSIDGTVAASSLTMLRAARAGLRTPWLARFMLLLAVAATLAANVAYGAGFGVAGALLSGWPGAAFVGCAEMALGMARRSRVTPAAMEAGAESAPEPRTLVTVPADAQSAARTALAASVAAGNPVSQRQLMTRFALTRTAERKVRSEVLAASNGHAPG